jgi:hypothetical protein
MSALDRVTIARLSTPRLEQLLATNADLSDDECEDINDELENRESAREGNPPWDAREGDRPYWA